MTPNFFSDYEAPDPVAGQNEVGYPVSVHADISAVLTVQSFTIQPRGGAALTTKLLQHCDRRGNAGHRPPRSSRWRC